MRFLAITAPAANTRWRCGVCSALLLSFAACSSSDPASGGKVVADNGPAPRQLQDAGPPPGTRLHPDQLEDAIPRDEPPSRYGNPASYSVFGQQYTTLASAKGFSETGLASWYGTKFHGRRTSSGEPYDMYAMTAAHKSLPLPSYVEVRNLDNGERAVVRVNDRGPFHSGRIIDLSYAAAVKLGVDKKGVARVSIRTLSAADAPSAPKVRTAQAGGAIDLTPSSAASTAASNQAQPTVVSVIGPAATVAPEILAEPASAAAAEAIAPTADIPAWYLQVGAFSERSNAENLRSRLLAAKLPEPRISEAQSASRTIYRLRIGPLSQQHADELLPSLAQAGIHDPQILQR